MYIEGKKLEDMEKEELFSLLNEAIDKTRSKREEEVINQWKLQTTYMIKDLDNIIPEVVYHVLNCFRWSFSQSGKSFIIEKSVKFTVFTDDIMGLIKSTTGNVIFSYVINPDSTRLLLIDVKINTSFLSKENLSIELKESDIIRVGDRFYKYDKVEVSKYGITPTYFKMDSYNLSAGFEVKLGTGRCRELGSIKAIVAVDKETMGIGFNNLLPWKISEDLKRFKYLTSDCNVVMGYNTMLSLGNPLPNRDNYVIVNSLEDKVLDGFIKIVKSNLNAVVEFISEERNTWVIGGSKTYKLLEELIDFWSITYIKGNNIKCNSFLDINLDKFESIYTSRIYDNDDFSWHYKVYERVNNRHPI